VRKLSFVIPVYRNSGSLAESFRRIESLVSTALKGHSFEVIFVDDGSDDGSLAELIEISNRDPRARVLALSRNFGQVAAIVAGLRETTGDAAIILSADLQEPVEKISEMVDDWGKGAEVVICYRQSREDSLGATLSSRIFYGLIHLASPSMPTTGFDFFLLGRPALNVINRLKERNRFFQGDVLWLGFPTKMLPYNRQKREIGVSQWTTSRKIKYFLDGLLSTSYWPIRAMSILGVLTFAVGVLYSVVIVFAWLAQRTPFTGWAPIMIVILLLGGLNMLMLGVLGEYVWRIFDEIRARPSYIIRNRYQRGLPLEESESFD
jgi:dolichol-phosphate mannosyltransferase